MATTYNCFLPKRKRKSQSVSDNIAVHDASTKTDEIHGRDVSTQTDENVLENGVLIDNFVDADIGEIDTANGVAINEFISQTEESLP